MVDRAIGDGGVSRVTTRSGHSKDLLFQVLLSATDPAPAIYTVPSHLRATITLLIVANTSNAGRTYRVHHSDSGAAAAVGNALRFNKALAANDDHTSVLGSTDDAGLTIGPGGVIHARADTADLVCISGYGFVEGLGR